MRNYLAILCCFISLFHANGQYTEVINSNRPGFNDSPYAVGVGVYQLEITSDIRYQEEVSNFTDFSAWTNQIDFHTGIISEYLEFHLKLADEQNWMLEPSLFGDSQLKANLFYSSVGLKFLVFQRQYKDPDLEIRSWKKKHAFDTRRLVPSIALEVGYNIPLFQKEPEGFLNAELENPNIHLLTKSNPYIKVLTQQNLSNRWTVLANFSYENLNVGVVSLGSHFILSSSSAVFIDYRGQINFPYNKHLWQTGFAKLLGENTQLNLGLGSNFNWDNKLLFANIGLSWRIDKHKDSFKLGKNSDQNEQEEIFDGFFTKQPSNFQDKKRAKRRKQKSKIRN